MNNQQQPNNKKLALTRDTYKALKHMDREQLSEYITNIYIKGYEAGKKATTPNNLMSAIRSTLLSVADIGPTRADAIMKRIGDVLGGGEQTAEPKAAQEATHAENFLVEALYNTGCDLCKMCIYDAECNAPENFNEDDHVPKEKCIKGALEYAKTNDAPRPSKTPQEIRDESLKKSATANSDELSAPSASIIDAGQIHGSTPPPEEGQKHQIVRGKVSGTGYPIDGHTLIFEIEKDGDVYYLINWADADDEAVMKTMHQADELYQDTPIEEFAELWKNQEWEPDGRFFLDSCKVEVVEVVKEFNE